MPIGKQLKRIIKGLGIAILTIIIVALVLVYQFLKPKSDQDVLRTFRKENSQIFLEKIKVDSHTIRILKNERVLDTTKSTLLFVHGSPGSALDFKRYFLDDELKHQFNLVSFDRVGYDNVYTGDILPSLTAEVELIEKLMSQLDIKNVILVGYSYGGTVVMTYSKKVKTKVAIAPSVNGSFEPQFWLFKMAQLDVLKPLLPKIAIAAANEKAMHIKSLYNIEKNWHQSKTPLVLIHGKMDNIVPYKNALFIKDHYPNKLLKFNTLPKANHGLLWSEFNEIKTILLSLN